MGVAAAQIGFDHQAGDGFRVLLRQAGRDEGAGDEGGEPVAGTRVSSRLGLVAAFGSMQRSCSP